MSYSRIRLSDLEELVSQIGKPEERTLIAEAVDCYYVGAYRAAIIVAWVAAGEVLSSRLREIAATDGDAKKRLDIVNQQKAKRGSIERELIVSFGNAQGCLQVFDEFEVEDLEKVADWRNHCAHSTGFRPNAEQARFAIRTVICSVLQKPLERGHGYYHLLLNQHVLAGKPITFQQPDVVQIRRMVSELRPSLRPTFLAECMQIVAAESSEQISSVAGAFGEQCLLQLPAGNLRDTALRSLAQQLDVIPRYCLGLLSKVPDFSSIPPDVRDKARATAQTFIFTNVNLADEEVGAIRELVSKNMLRPEDVGLTDIAGLHNAIRSSPVGAAMNFTRCFPREIANILSAVFRTSFVRATSEQRLGMFQAIEAMGLLDLQSVSMGRWSTEFPLVLAEVADLELAYAQAHGRHAVGDDPNNPHDLQFTLGPDADLLLDRKALELIRRAGQFPESIAERIVDEAAGRAEDSAGRGILVDLIWLEILESWVQRQHDLTNRWQVLMAEKPEAFRIRQMNPVLASIGDWLAKSRYADSARLVRQLQAQDTPF